MQILPFKNITQSMKSFSIVMVKSCGPYKYTNYIHVSVAISACCHKPKTHPHAKKGGCRRAHALYVTFSCFRSHGGTWSLMFYGEMT